MTKRKLNKSKSKTKTKTQLNKSKTKTQKNMKKNGERKLVDEWKGKMIGENTHIQIFTIPNNKRKPIIKIKSKSFEKTVDGPLLSLRFLPPTYDFKGKTVYRLSLYYRKYGSHQGGPIVAYREHITLFSKYEKQINKIGKMLSKYTTDIKYSKS